jgi:hypothetical protein
MTTSTSGAILSFDDADWSVAMPGTPRRFWTGASPVWSLQQNCGDWGGVGAQGTTGLSSGIGDNFYSDFQVSCGTQLRLLCAEQ